MANVEQIKKKILEDICNLEDGKFCGCYDRCDCLLRHDAQMDALISVLYYFGLNREQTKEATKALRAEYKAALEKQVSCQTKKLMR